MRGWIVASLMLALSAPAGAQEPAEDPEQNERFEQAREHFKNAKLAYDLGKFEEAARLFERAYALRPAPLLLYNLGQSYRKLGDWQRAVHAYEGFLREADPELPQFAVAEEALRDAREHLAEQREREREEAAVEVDEPPPPPRPVPTVSAAEEEPEDDSSLLIWAAVGSGVAVLAVAAGATLVALAAAGPAPGDGGRLDLR